MCLFSEKEQIACRNIYNGQMSKENNKTYPLRKDTGRQKTIKGCNNEQSTKSTGRIPESGKKR